MDVQSLLDDDRLSGADRAALIAKHWELSEAQARRGQEARAGRWRTPLAVALTGVITLAAQFGFDHLAAQQGADHAERAEARAFQFKLLKSELARFEEDDPDLRSKRAQTLLFLAQAGLLPDLDAGFLAGMACADLRDDPLCRADSGIVPKSLRDWQPAGYVPYLASDGWTESGTD